MWDQWREERIGVARTRWRREEDKPKTGWWGWRIEEGGNGKEGAEWVFGVGGGGLGAKQEGGKRERGRDHSLMEGEPERKARRMEGEKTTRTLWKVRQILHSGHKK